MENMSLGTPMIKLRVGRQVGGDRGFIQVPPSSQLCSLPAPARSPAHTLTSQPAAPAEERPGPSSSPSRPCQRPPGSRGHSLCPWAKRAAKKNGNFGVILTTPSLLSSSIQHSPAARPRRGSGGAGCGGWGCGGRGNWAAAKIHQKYKYPQPKS